MTSWATGVNAITLFVEDLGASEQFYRAVFDAVPVFQDADSVVFSFGSTLVNLLDATQAGVLVEPDEVGGADTPARSMLTIFVTDVDAICARLGERGVTLLNGPIDRPWGPRTACFADPSGHKWEIAAT